MHSVSLHLLAGMTKSADETPLLHRVTEERKATVDLVAAEETVVKRVIQELKELKGRR